MIILDKAITKEQLSEYAPNYFDDMVKAVADVGKNRLAIDAELHADLERILLESGSNQEDLWGFNLYPDNPDEDLIEFDSLINIRPWQDNRSRDVENEDVREKIVELVKSYIR